MKDPIRGLVIGANCELIVVQYLTYAGRLVELQISRGNPHPASPIDDALMIFATARSPFSKVTGSYRVPNTGGVRFYHDLTSTKGLLLPSLRGMGLSEEPTWLELLAALGRLEFVVEVVHPLDKLTRCKFLPCGKHPWVAELSAVQPQDPPSDHEYIR